MVDEEILQRVYDLLERGAANSRDDFHTAALCTVSERNEPEARTVVFRRLLQNPPSVCCHIDLRSPKAFEIQQNPQTSWLFYHRTVKLQLRIRGASVLHTTDELADAQWNASELFSLRAYCGTAPTTAVETSSSGLPEPLQDRRPTIEEANEFGRPNFAVLRTIISELDVYELNAHGHRRSLFTFDSTGAIEMRWLTP